MEAEKVYWDVFGMVLLRTLGDASSASIHLGLTSLNVFYSLFKINVMHKYVLIAYEVWRKLKSLEGNIK